MAEKRTIEILLQFKQAGAEVIKQTQGLLNDLANPLRAGENAFQGFANAGKQSLQSVNTKLETFRQGLKDGTVAVKVFSTAAQAGFAAVWTALTGPFELLVKIGGYLASFLNPFKLQGIVTGAAFGGAGLLAKEWIEAADGAERYRSLLKGVVNDQGIANRLFDEFEELSQRTGIEAEQQAETFIRLYELRVKDAEAATKTLTGVSAFKQISLDELTNALSNPNGRTLKRLGIDMNDLGHQIELVSADIRMTVDNTEQDIRQGLIDMFDKKFPNAVQDASQFFSTQMAIFRVNLGQFAQDFGAILLPEATRVLKRINDFLRENRDTIVAVIRSIPEIVSEVINEIITRFKNGSIVQTIINILQPLQDHALKLLTAWFQIVYAELRIFCTAVASIIDVLLVAIQAELEIWFQNLLPRMINSIKNSVKDLPGWGQAVLAAAPGGPGILGAAYSNPDLPVKPMKDIGKEVSGNLKSIVADRSQEAIDEGKKLLTAIKTFSTEIKKTASDTGDAVWGEFGGLFGRITQLVQKKLAEAKSAAAQNRSDKKAENKLEPLPAIRKLQLDALTGTSSEQAKSKAELNYQSQLESVKQLVKGFQNADEIIAAEDKILQQQRDQEIKEAAANERQIVLQTAADIAGGFEKMRIQNMASYEKQKTQLDKLYNNGRGPLSYEQYVAATKKNEQDFVDANQRTLDQMRLARDEFNIAITKGIERQAAEAQRQYDQDVASWRIKLQNKEITQEQFNQAQIAAAERQQEALIAIERKRAEAKAELDTLILKSQQRVHEAELVQIQARADAEVEKYRQMHEQGLINDQQFMDARKAIAENSARERMLIEGSFTDGAKLGMDEYRQNLATTAQFGKQAALETANSISSNFGSAFADMVTGAKSAGEAFRSMAQSILSDMTRLFAQRAMMNALSSVFGGTSFGSILGFAEGGMNPYPDTGRDYVPAMLRGGEFMVRPEIVRKPGVLQFLERLNGGMGNYAKSIAAASSGLRFASGGLMPAITGSGADLEKSITVRAIVPIGSDEVSKIFREPAAIAAIQKVAIQTQKLAKS